MPHNAPLLTILTHCMSITIHWVYALLIHNLGGAGKAQLVVYLAESHTRKFPRSGGNYPFSETRSDLGRILFNVPGSVGIPPASCENLPGRFPRTPKSSLCYHTFPVRMPAQCELPIS